MHALVTKKAVENRRDCKVEIGSTVRLRDLDTHMVETYTLVRPDEADIVRNRVSSFSPLGLALGGRCVGDIIEVDAPGGWVHLEIEDVLSAADSLLLADDLA